MFLSQLKVSQKLWGIAALVFSGTLLIAFISLFSLRTSLIEDRKIQTQFLVESAYSILDSYYQQYKSGQLTESEAKQNALANIRSMRYGDSGYFWINDMQAVVVLHPIKPELEGKDVSQAKDPMGKILFMEFINTVRKQKSGFVDYYWAKPGSAEPVPKLSFVKGFQPWDYVLGTGIYIDDVDEIYMQKVWQYGSISLAGIVLVVFFSIFLIRDIKNPITTLQQIMFHVQEKQDLTKRVDMKRKDELGDMGDSFNHMLEKFRDMLSHVNDSITHLNETGNEMGEISRRTNTGIQRQHQQTELLASAMEQMLVAAEEVARGAVNAADAAYRADISAENGEEMVGDIILSINDLASDVSESAGVMKELKGDVENISSILAVIRGIADQTNLLALNAAIEAARAGEQGRGFAVVADEVRTLAQRTQEATQEIQSMIEQLQQRSDTAGEAMTKGCERATLSVKQVTQAGEALKEIHTSITEINNMNSQIATAAEEQTAVANEMRSSISDISQVASNTASESEQIQRVNNNLEKLTVESHQLVKQFVV